MDDATFNNILQHFTDSGSAGHDLLRAWTAGLDDALKALPVVVASQAAPAPAPMAAVPNPSAMGVHAAQQYAAVSAATTYYGNDSSAAPPQMLQQTMTTPVPPPFGYDWAGQVPLDMSYAVQATTAAYATADAAWPYSGPAFGALPQMAHSATFHDTETVVQPPPPPPPPPPLAVTHDYAAPTDVYQSTYPAEASYVGPVVGEDAQSSAGSLRAPSHTQQTNGQRNSAAPSAPQDGARTEYRPIAPKPAPPSVATPSTSTAASPVPHAPGTSLFPAQAPRLVLAPYSGILRGAPPSELLDEAPMAASLAMLVPPALSRNMSVPKMAPAAKQPRHATKKPRKLAAASKQRGQPAPAAASHVPAPPSGLAQSTLVPSEKRAPPASPGPANVVEVQAAPTATLLNRNAAPELAPSMQAPVPYDDAGPATVVQGEEPASEVASAAPGQVVGQEERHDESAARRAKPAVQRKRGRPDAGSEKHSHTKRAVTDELWQMRSLDFEESSLPVGHRVQSGNNLVSPQHSHTLQRSSPSPPQGTGPRASAGPSSGTPAASGSCPLTSTGAAQGSGAAAGPSGPGGEATEDEEDGTGRKKGGKKKKKTKRIVDKSTNALGSLQAGLKWYSWMTPN